ncbi:MAG: phenylacetate--CoA ligase family protein [Bauldia sp.]|nr:phenylacetate--CoA ligase family protein [Bauldia sp.]
MFDPEIEALPFEAQAGIDDVRYRRQLGYLFANSRFYRAKLAAAGIDSAEAAGGLDAIAALPMTEKDEIRQTRSDDEPVGTHLCVPLGGVARIFSTSGTTGTPSYIPLTANDIANWTRISARSYSASGIRRGDALVSTYGAGPFVAGITLDAFNLMGLCHIPIGSGNTERLMTTVRLLKPHAIALTPSYALHLAEWAHGRGIDIGASNVARLLTAGEPGGGEPAMRKQLEAAWGATVTEVMGIGDIAASLWGECPEQGGMHFSGRGFVHVELIDPDTGAAIEMTDGAEGELVYTHLAQEAVPLLRFRSRDHVRVTTERCACGRTAPRVRCIGRTDDMLIVRGVNVFPSAIRDLVGGFGGEVSGVVSIRPRLRGFRQDPPLRVLVESGGSGAADDLAARITARLREAMLVSTEITVVPFGSLPRSDYKSKLVDWSDAAQ